MMDGATAQWGTSGPAAANSARTDTLRTGTFSIWMYMEIIADVWQQSNQSK